jgi:hypothetical protein
MFLSANRVHFAGTCASRSGTNAPIDLERNFPHLARQVLPRRPRLTPSPLDFRPDLPAGPRFAWVRNCGRTAAADAAIRELSDTLQSRRARV